MDEKRRAFVGITGASGSIYGVRLIQELVKQKYFVEICFSSSGLEVARFELGLKLIDDVNKIRDELISSLAPTADYFTVLDEDNLFSAPASGSNQYEAIFVVPCSMSTLAHIAYGTNRHLIHRAGEVALKQGYPLILLPRETPVSLVHLRAMVAAVEAGAKIVLPTPAFYPKPKTIDDIVDFIVGKVLDAAGIKNELYNRWE